MISIQVDTTSALRGLSDLQQRQVPFAISKALNALANKAQAAERARLTGAFNLRRVKWNLDAIYISKQDRATKTSWLVVIQVQDSRSYLNKFEQGGEKIPHKGRKNLAIPNPVVFRSGIVPKGSPLKPAALNLRHVGGKWEGDQRTFIAPFKRNDEAGIFQRLGRDKRGRAKKNKGVRGRAGVDANVRLLYTLISRVPIKAQLHFVSTIGETVQREWASTMNEAMAYALKTAR